MADGHALGPAGGTLRLEGNTITNATGSGIRIEPTGGTVNVILTNNTIVSPQRDGILLSETNNPTVNWTEVGTNLRSTGQAGLGQGSGWFFDINDTAVLNATHTNCTSNVTNSVGYEFNANSGSNVTVVMVGCNITGGPDRGVIFNANDSSVAKARFTNDTFTGNSAGFGFEAGPSTLATLCLRMNGNTADTYRFFNNNPAATFKFENFGNASGSLFTTENTGAVNVLGGTITNVTIGSCGIP